MIDLKKIDEFDFVFINRPLKEVEEKEFSDFLRKRNSDTKTIQKRKVLIKSRIKN